MGCDKFFSFSRREYEFRLKLALYPMKTACYFLQNFNVGAKELPFTGKIKDKFLEIRMKLNIRNMFICFLTISATAACTPQTPPPPTVDTISTIAMQLASQMLTETVAAYSPTPVPPTETAVPTATETLPPTVAATEMPKLIEQASPCYAGPGSTYPLISNISGTKKVEIVGIGSTAGWYIIKNPYFGSTCWISAENLILDPNSDFSSLPVMSP
jgi:hypothetical protein